MNGRSWTFVKRSVVSRVLLSYVLVVLAFAIVAGWSALALRQAAGEAGLMRSGFYPLALTVRDLAAKQDTYNSQLNYITDAPNPKDLRIWFDFALRVGRPKLFGQVRAALQRAFFSSEDTQARRVGEELKAEVSAIERFFAQDAETLTALFDALDQAEKIRAERLREELVTRGSRGSARLARLELRVEQEVDRLLDQARTRERWALRFLIGLTGSSLLVGIAMALYARRVLRPLAAVTARAAAVAGGDLLPREPIRADDEIGELSTTFESMVRAIAHANEQLVASERLATIGKMAAHVTHEIRNPLSSIALNLELLEEDLGAEANEAKTLVRAIGGEVERLNSLSQQYLSFARQRPSSLLDEDLREVVRDACEFMRRELGRDEIELSLRTDERLASMPIDEAQIKQAVFNLLRNARDAMPQGGTIRVSVQSTERGARVVIEDQGEGLDADARSRLFEPFFTTKSYGTGLGLAITRQIVQAHGGSIEFSERPEGGTRVTLFLPRVQARLELEAREDAGGR